MSSKRILLTTVGTTGDVQPYLALARGLISRGHRVRACSHAIHRERFLQHGIEFVGGGPPFTIEGFNELLRDVSKEMDPYRQFVMLAERFFLQEPERQFEEHRKATEDVDLVVAQRFDWIGQEAAIHAKKPWVSVTFVPEVLRTDEAPPFPFP